MGGISNGLSSPLTLPSPARGEGLIRLGKWPYLRNNTVRAVCPWAGT